MKFFNAIVKILTVMILFTSSAFTDEFLRQLFHKIANFIAKQVNFRNIIN